MKQTRIKTILHRIEVVGLICIAAWIFISYQPIKTSEQEKWVFPAGGCGDVIVQGDGRIICGSTDGKVYAINPAGEEIWSCDLETRDINRVSQGNDQTTYVINRNCDLFAIDTKGNLLWKNNIDPDGPTGKLTIGDDAIYFTNVSSITSIATDGTINWTRKDGRNCWKKLLITDDGKLIIGHGAGRHGNIFLVSINPDGSTDWFTQIPSYICGEAVQLPNGDIVATSVEGLICFDKDGVFKWNILEDIHFESDALVDNNGIIYCISMDGVVYAVDETGNLIWERELKAHGMRRFGTQCGMTLWEDSSLLIGTYGIRDLGSIQRKYIQKTDPYGIRQQPTGYLFSLSKETGKEQWYFKTAADIEATPAFNQDGTIYIQSKRNGLYAIDPR